MPFFSIIIPVYKVEEYLGQCVESVLCQSYKDFEVILVDDGSPDACPVLCDDLARQDHRIKVLHQPNGGASDARNNGLKIATGTYILFLDSDDYWDDPNALAIIQKRLTGKEIDILLYGCKDLKFMNRRCRISRGGYDASIFREGDKTAILNYLYASDKFPGSAWILATRRTLLTDNGIDFIKGIKSEDTDWLLNVLSHAQTIDAIDLPFYVYRRFRDGSVTSTVDTRHVGNMVFILKKWCDKLMAEDREKSPLLAYVSYHYLSTLLCYASLGSRNAEIENELRRYQSVLAYTSGRGNKLAAALVNFFGINRGGKLLNRAYKLKRAWASR